MISSSTDRNLLINNTRFPVCRNFREIWRLRRNNKGKSAERRKNPVMECVILPCKSVTSTSVVSDFSSRTSKPTISYNNAHQPANSRSDLGMADAHLNYLVRNKRLTEAIAALDSIASSGSKIRQETFAKLIYSCVAAKSIQLGRELNNRIDLLAGDVTLIQTRLVGMFAKCGSLEDARELFDGMRERDLYAWSAMIGAYSREKIWREVMKLFFSMMEDGIVPDAFLFPKILQACGNCGDIDTGKLIHALAIRCGVDGAIRVSNSILAVYANCGELSSAKILFDTMNGRDAVSWNSLINGYCLKGEIEEARRLFVKMKEQGIEPGLVSWNILISNYNQLGYCDVAMEMMKEMKDTGITPDVFTWTSVISGFAQNNRRSHALELFRDMRSVGAEPNGVTLTSAISASASLKALRKGKELHSLAVKLGFTEEVLVGNSLIDMYSKCGEIDDARRVFDKMSKKDVFSWNSMIGGYCQAGYCGKAHSLFKTMQESNVRPNVITWNSMIAGYMQNGDEDQAMDLFWRMEDDGAIKRNTASWNALIAGYLQNGRKNMAFRMFRQMQFFCFRPNSVTILSILPAFTNLLAAKRVREIHSFVLRNLAPRVSVSNSLIDAYAMSGNIVYSRTIFDGMHTKDIITWNTMIAGFVLHGCANVALSLYEQMKKEGLKPDKSTFLSIISAYGLAKMVEEGKQVLSSMTQDNRLAPCTDHYAAVIDLFGRSGRVEEAIQFIEDMDVEPDFSVWAALLTACRINGNLEMAVQAGRRLLVLEPENALIQQLVAQMRESHQNSDDSLKLKRPGKRVVPTEFRGWSCIEVKNRVHNFATGDQCQPNGEELYKDIAGKVGRSGNCYKERLAIEEEEKEEIVGFHSEKLALAFALVNCHGFGSVRIMKKKLRMCEDCHQTAKYISKAYRREIYLSDSKVLHSFKDGCCSCGDYW